MWNQERCLAALKFAAQRHGAQDQKVPGTDLPYVVHVVSVCMEVLAAIAAGDDTFDADLAVVCALLHDVLEDTPTPFDEVARAFGEDVARGVLALTKNEALDKAAAMADSLRRIREQPAAIAAVKLADRTTNLQPPPAHWSAEKCRRYLDEAVVILDALRGASPYLERRLTEKLRSYARFAAE